MRLSYLAPAAGLAAALGCTSSIQVGTDGQGGHTTTTSTSSSSGTTTTGSTTSSSSGTTTSSSSGSSGSSCWDGTPVSTQGGPCGGNLWTNPPTCASGLTCHQGLPDAVGTCAPASTPVNGEGGNCGGFTMNPAICSWDTTCKASGVPDAPGTCVLKACAGGGTGCTNPVVTVTGDGATKEYDFICQGSQAGTNPKAAIGYIGYPAPMPGQPEEVWIKGCLIAGATDFQGSLSLNAPIAMVGSSNKATVQYDSGTDTYGNGGTGTLEITQLDSDTIAGTYSAAVMPSNSNNVTMISGTFKVCRTPDFLPP